MLEGLMRRLGYAKFSQPLQVDPEGIGARIISGNQRSIPRRGTRDLLQAYRESPVLQAVVRKIAYGVASVDWWAAAKVEDGQGETRMDDHIMARLLMRGTPFMSGLQARTVSQIHMELVGESFEVLERNLVGAPAMKWPIPPHWVMDVPQPGDPFFSICPPNGAEVVKLPMRDVLWRRDVDPERPYERGTGIGYALADELNADEYAAKHLASSLANRARPDIIVSGSKEAPLVREDVERMSAIWADRFRGAERAGRPLFSSAPVNVHDLTPSFRELDLTGLRAYERDIIITVFGVPPEIVGVLQNSNRATIESAEFFFTKHVILPRLEAASADYNTQLAPQYDERLRARFDNPVDEDRDFIREAMAGTPDAYTLDEHRALTGHDPLEDEQGQIYPLRFATDYRRLDGETLVAEPEAKRAKAAPVRKMDNNGIDDAANAVDDSLFMKILASAYEESMAWFGEAALESVGIDISFNLFDPAVRTFIENNAAERSRLIGGTTRDALRKTLGQGVAEGETTTQLVKRIRSVVTDASPRRARMISRTEIVRSSNAATMEAHKQAGIEQRQWLATADDRVRDEHQTLDGKTVGIDQPFEVDGHSAMYPGDFGVAELDINCRCGLSPVINFEGDKQARAALWTKFDNSRRQFEQMLARQSVAAFAEQEKAVIAKVMEGAI